MRPIRGPNEVLLPYSLSRKLPLQLQSQLGHQGVQCVHFGSKCPKTEDVPCMQHPWATLKKTPEGGRSIAPTPAPARVHTRLRTYLKKREDVAEALYSIQNRFHVRTVLCMHGSTTLPAGKRHLCSWHKLKCSTMVTWVKMD